MTPPTEGGDQAVRYRVRCSKHGLLLTVFDSLAEASMPYMLDCGVTHDRGTHTIERHHPTEVEAPAP